MASVRAKEKALSGLEGHIRPSTSAKTDYGIFSIPLDICQHFFRGGLKPGSKSVSSSRHAPSETGNMDVKTRNSQPVFTMEVGGLCEVMGWVMGFGKHAEVLEPAHLRQAVASELAATAGKYVEEPAPMYQQGPEHTML